MSVEEFRLFAGDWLVVIAAVIGAIAAWPRAHKVLNRWWSTINLLARTHRLEEDVTHLLTHAHDDDGRPLF